ncbi:hypothetical protein FRC07_000908 [Ceratobasidium sp. 392]|nr:hypothetical protein FRC07_000908 [Ceratobasidium sp. 392]
MLRTTIDLEALASSQTPGVPLVIIAATIERTLLSYARLGLILFVLSASLLLKARIPDPDDENDQGDAEGSGTFPLGIIYSVASIIVVIAGWANYESDLKGLLEERGFVGGFQ